MAAATELPEGDWLGACRRATEGIREVLAGAVTREERVRETGEVGEGGDHTLEIDRAAEDCVFAELDALHEGGARFTAISEERGAVDYGDPGVLVVIDPIDGSLNAKRGLRPASLSVAVATGPTMGDVAFGYVNDLGAGEEWTAAAGDGARLNGEPLAPVLPERRLPDGRLEVVLAEMAAPAHLARRSDGLVEVANRVRLFGSVAIACCQVAAGRADAMVSLVGCRAVDAAAAQFVVRAAGGVARFDVAGDPLAFPLADFDGRASLVAAASEAAADDAARIIAAR